MNYVILSPILVGTVQRRIGYLLFDEDGDLSYLVTDISILAILGQSFFRVLSSHLKNKLNSIFCHV